MATVWAAAAAGHSTTPHQQVGSLRDRPGMHSLNMLHDKQGPLAEQTGMTGDA